MYKPYHIKNTVQYTAYLGILAVKENKHTKVGGYPELPVAKYNSEEKTCKVLPVARSSTEKGLQT